MRYPTFSRGEYASSTAECALRPHQRSAGRKHPISWTRALGAGVTCGIFYLLTLAAISPDVAWLSVRNPTHTRYMERLGVGRALSSSTPLGWKSIDSVSVFLICAVVKAEDKRFFEHNGVDWLGTRHALYASIRGGGLTGGSTITQQTARNLFLGPDRTLTRKVRELLLARELEASLAKPRILELYLNVIERGNGVWGVEAASTTNFNNPPSELDPFEATFLAGLIAAPRAPVRGRNAERVRRVQTRVIFQLYGSGVLSREEAWTALDQITIAHRLLSKEVPIERAMRTVALRQREGNSVVSRRFRLPARDLAAPLDRRRALAEGCGWEREKAGAGVEPSK